MAALTKEAPEEEAVFAGILTGKTVEDREAAAKTGMELLEKYGYDLKDSFGAGALPGMAGGMMLILAAGLAACAGLAWHSMRLKREARERGGLSGGKAERGDGPQPEDGGGTPAGRSRKPSP